jgi:RND family efflux transporter MFP subunit
MKSGFSRMYLILGGVVAVIVIGLVVAGSRPTPQEFVTVSRGDITQEVSVTGRVKAVSNADLGLERSGRISWVSTAVGNRVVAGQSLLAIENSDLAADIERSRANVKKEEATLAELKRGTRPEELKVQESEVANATVALEDAKKGLVDAIVDSYTRSDDAVRNKIDLMFTNPRSQNPELSFIQSDYQLKNDVVAGRSHIETTLTQWEKAVRTLSVNDSIDSALTLSKKSLEEARLLLEKIGLAVNSLYPTSTLSQTTIDTYKSSISTARTNINTGIANLSAADEKFRNAAGLLATAERELSLKRAGSTAEDIAAQEAALEYAQAQVKSSEALLAKTVIRAPFTGIVVKLDAHVGEILSANTPVVTLISDGKFMIEANVPEADIAKVAVGNAATVTLDAYGSEVNFPAVVSIVEPGETIIDGVPTYKVTFEFVNQDQRIKSGMTANIDIAVNSKKGALLVAQKAIVSKNGGKTVTVSRGGVLEEVVIKTGLRGDSGFIEVVSGLSEGDSVLVPTTK